MIVLRSTCLPPCINEMAPIITKSFVEPLPSFSVQTFTNCIVETCIYEAYFVCCMLIILYVPEAMTRRDDKPNESGISLSCDMSFRITDGVV